MYLATPFEQQERNYFSELNKSSILLLAQLQIRLINATKYRTAPYIRLLVLLFRFNNSTEHKTSSNVNRSAMNNK